MHCLSIYYNYLNWGGALSDNPKFKPKREEISQFTAEILVV